MLMNDKIQDKKKHLPKMFKPLLWSYIFSKIEPEKDKKTIIVNTINYGDLIHWRWLVTFYGKQVVRKILKQIVDTEIRPPVRRLASLLFSIENFNHVSRGAAR